MDNDNDGYSFKQDRDLVTADDLKKIKEALEDRKKGNGKPLEDIKKIHGV